MGPPSGAAALPPGAEETILLGRRAVSGIVNASRLANIVRTLRSSVSAHRPTYWLWLSEQGLEVRGPKYDEGFESDDSTSTKSGGEERAGDTSSGVSDLDDASDTSLGRVPKELFCIRDIVFCHSDAAFPRVLVWVVNGPRRPTPACLEALVFECRSEASVRRLSARYQDTSKRLKMQMLTLKRPTGRPDVEHVVPDRLDGLDRWRDKYVRQREPPSLLSVRPDDEWSQMDEPPRRPERRRFVRRKPHEDILRGTFVRVNVVDPKPSPVLLKPQFTWMYGVPATAELVLSSQSVPVSRSRRSCRSVSPSLSRRMALSQPLRSVRLYKTLNY